MFKAIAVPNFLPEEDCKYVIEKAIKSNLWQGGGNQFWENRVINYESIKGYDIKVASILKDVNTRCKKLIQEQYSLNKPVYADTLQIIRWFPEMEQHPHADDMTNTEIKGFEHRAFGSILYLNNDYNGGHTYYPNHGIEIIPEVGKLAIHPGDPEHLHGVTKIKNENRYTIASFWTLNKERSYVFE